MSFIELQDVSKDFRIKRRESGPLSGLKEFFHPQYDIKRAVDGVSLNVEQGEMVGYIGPNGAGKSTTLKMLTGILVPTSGRALVDGKEPYRNRRANALRMGAVFGQRSQLLWDLPVQDALELNQRMYQIERAQYEKNRDRFVEMLGMRDFLKQPARQLSLGQKMRANLALALLHDPKVLYLDEPTIGLDVLAKDSIRSFLAEINREQRTTVILTTHDMADIESVCQRLILIDGGKKLYDGALGAFKARYGSRYALQATFNGALPQLADARFEVLHQDGQQVTYSIERNEIKPGEALSLLARQAELVDVEVRETPIEEIVRNLYQNSMDEKQAMEMHA